MFELISAEVASPVIPLETIFLIKLTSLKVTFLKVTLPEIKLSFLGRPETTSLHSYLVENS